MNRLAAFISAAVVIAALAAGCERSEARVQAGPGAGQRVAVESVRGSGVVRGSVALRGPAPEMRRIQVNEACCENEPPLLEETAIVNPNGTLRNVFVYIENGPLTDGSTLPPALLDQVRCRYVPHALGVQVGQPLRLRSSDPTMHNVHFVPRLNPAKNYSMTEAGHEVTTRFSSAEFIRMKCDVHPWMTAWVGVFDNPFFAVTGDDGDFAIDGLPAGTYTLVAWHELYGRQEQTVTVADQQPAQVDFVFGKPPDAS